MARVGPIAILLFGVRVDEVTCGLIDESEEARGELAEPYPDRWASTRPGMARYDT